ncbi:MAG: 30S ribosome-binding factor RbfA [Alphaproteobacteria bacterium]
MESKMPSQRQLRVGEEIRQALAQIFAHGETHIPALDSGSITVSEVRISPDLKNATVYVMPLAGSNKETIMAALKEHTSRVRHLLSRKVLLRHLPKLLFKLDTSYEVASRIHQLLESDRVKRDTDDAN